MGWIGKLIIMLLIGMACDFLFLLGALQLTYLSDKDIGLFLLLFTSLFICSVILPYSLDHFINKKISNNAENNNIGALFVACMIEIILFIMGIFLIKKNIGPECYYFVGVSHNPVGITVAFVFGMIIFNLKIFILANRVNNPTGIILLNVAVSVLYSILIYTVLIDIVISVIILFLTVVIIGVVLIGMAWNAMWEK